MKKLKLLMLVLFFALFVNSYQPTGDWGGDDIPPILIVRD